jgi:hypothetical protein
LHNCVTLHEKKKKKTVVVPKNGSERISNFLLISIRGVPWLIMSVRQVPVFGRRNAKDLYIKYSFGNN